MAAVVPQNGSAAVSGGNRCPASMARAIADKTEIQPSQWLGRHQP